MGTFVDLTGNKYGKLTVVSYERRGKDRDSYWLCNCDCGRKIVVKGGNLNNGHTKSCGCNRSNNALKHGKVHERLYCIWLSMKQRCGNQKAKSYRLYGAEGKSVCDEWRDDFQAFYDWAMAHGYSDELTIERINNTKGYCPENCRWATRKEQNNNKRNNITITYNGRTQTLSQWANELCINYMTLYSRLYRNHWTIEKAFSCGGDVVCGN